MKTKTEGQELNRIKAVLAEIEHTGKWLVNTRLRFQNGALSSNLIYIH